MRQDDEREDEGVTFEYDLVDYIWHVPIPLEGDYKYYAGKFSPKPTVEKFKKTLERLEKEGLIQKGKNTAGNPAYVGTDKGHKYIREPYPLK